MKEGWEYKKLGEVSRIVGGSTPKTNIEEYWGGDHYWITPAELTGSKYQSKSKRTITNLAVEKSNLQLLPKGTVLLSSRAPIGKVAITTVPMYCNQGFKNIICSEKLFNEYIYWFLSFNTAYLNSLGNGATFKEISKTIVENITVPVPPLSEQKLIVKELDLLSGIIEKQKQQLKELDTLAQSIFYEMFGSYNNNIKKLDVEPLENVFELITDGTHQTPKYTEDKNLGYKFLSAKDVISGKIDWSKIKYIPKELHFQLSKRLSPQIGDILLCKNGTVGIAALVETNEIFDIYVSLALLRTNKDYNKIYLKYAINNLSTRNQFLASVKGIGVPNLYLKEIKKTKILIPPLHLQNLFAEKIEAIEKQKEAISKSIEETQKLFDYTMDKYFG